MNRDQTESHFPSVIASAPTRGSSSGSNLPADELTRERMRRLAAEGG